MRKEEKDSKKASFYANEREIKRSLILNHPLLVLLYKEALFNINKLEETLPSSIVSLLQEFQDVFPKDVPNGLPRIRGIERQIDFIPGVSISNKPAYKINREETKELKGKSKR